jgi:hypothetical protein
MCIITLMQPFLGIVFITIRVLKILMVACTLGNVYYCPIGIIVFIVIRSLKSFVVACNLGNAYLLGFEVFVMVTMKNVVFWVVAHVPTFPRNVSSQPLRNHRNMMPVPAMQSTTGSTCLKATCVMCLPAVSSF